MAVMETTMAAMEIVMAAMAVVVTHMATSMEATMEMENTARTNIKDKHDEKL